MSLFCMTGLVMKWLLRKPYTSRYPFEPRQPLTGSRGSLGVSLTDCTFSGNSAGGAYPQSSTTGNGGAIFNAAGRLELVNATLADNAAGVNWSWSSTCGLGTAVYGGAALTNTILRGAGACSGTFADGGHNLDSSGSCGVGPATDPLLSTAGLASNGGPTQTVALQDGSPAIAAGDGAVCAAAPVLGVDQRGYARPGGGAANCSIGAFEYGAAP